MCVVAAGGPLDGERVGGAGAPRLQQRADLVGLVDRFAVDGDDHVVQLEHLRGRATLDACSARRCRWCGCRHRDRGARAPPRWRSSFEVSISCALYRRFSAVGPAAADRLLGQHVDVIVEPAGQRLEQRRGADADRRVRDRLLRRVARGALHEHLLGDRPGRSGSHVTYGTGTSDAPSTAKREHARRPRRAAIQRRRGRRRVDRRARRARPRAVARRAVVPSAHSVVSNGPRLKSRREAAGVEVERGRRARRSARVGSAALRACCSRCCSPASGWRAAAADRRCSPWRWRR